MTVQAAKDVFPLNINANELIPACFGFLAIFFVGKAIVEQRWNENVKDIMDIRLDCPKLDVLDGITFKCPARACQDRPGSSSGVKADIHDP